jgi:hypothetical protein
MKKLPLLVSVTLMSATATPWALAQNTVGIGAQSVPNQSPSVSLGSYSKGFTGPGLTGPGSYGSGSYGPGSYNSGGGASTRPLSPFTYFNSGGAAAGTSAIPTGP